MLTDLDRGFFTAALLSLGMNGALYELKLLSSSYCYSFEFRLNGIFRDQ